MIHLRRLLWHDLGRKVLALVLALFVWLQTYAAVVDQRDYSMQIKVGDQTGVGEEQAPIEPGTLTIQVPSSWVLMSPKEGESVNLRFSGPRDELNQFLSSNPGAIYKPDSNSLMQERSLLENPTPLDLKWLAGDTAKRFLEPMEEANNNWMISGVRLVKKEIMTVELRPWMVEVSGDGPAPTHKAILNELSFPNLTTVDIEGPFEGVQALEQSIRNYISLLEVAERDNVPVTESPPRVLEVLNVPANRRDSLVDSLQLAAELRNQGIIMSPEWVEASLPIRIENPTQVEWQPAQEMLQLIGKDRDSWEIRSWNPPPIKAFVEENYYFSTSTITETWLTKRIALVVNVDSIPAQTEEKFHRLRLDWFLSANMSDAEKEQYYSALRLVPAQGNEDSFWMVDIRRKE